MLVMSRTRKQRVQPPNGDSFGQQLRSLRKSQGWTQGELGEMVGVSTRAVCSYERNECEPPMQVLVALASAFGISIDALLGMKPGVKAKPTPSQRRWIRKFEQIEKLPERKQRTILQVIDMAMKSVS